jgi:thiol-disulfide isomerase/thioredoxin
MSARLSDGAIIVHMKNSLLCVLACLLIAACGDESSELGQGDVAPAWTGTTFDGVEIEFPDALDGKPAVLVVWATWCSYCKAFMPYLKAIQDDYGTEQIQVLAINAKEDGSGDPAAYVAGLDLPMLAIRDGDAIAAAYDVEYIPGLMVIDADGAIAYRRAWTELPAGSAVASAWSIQVRQSLNRLLR